MQVPKYPTTQSPDSEIGSYYDRLSRWTKVAGLIGYGGGRGMLSVHRSLADPLANGRATPTRLNDILEALVRQHVPRGAEPRLLDAGCGLGGVMLDLVCSVGGTAVGLTLSSAQAREARRAAERVGVSSRVDVLTQSYDEPPAGPFDLVIAIESLAHSADPGHSLSVLARRLSPGGLLLVVDDMPETAAESTADLATFKSAWHCPVLWSVAHYQAALQAMNLVTQIQDLTPGCRPRELAAIDRLERWNRLAHTVVPLAGWRVTLASFAGGLALERLYRRGLMRYCLIAATKA